MSEIQEKTEANLAAYIDGELEQTDRAEIERLLEQNPNYRRVLEQLRGSRDLLRNLSREAAPPELAEAFTGQLERSVLLHGITEKRRSGLPAGRGPQFAAIAAIVFLTLGLGALFYFALPKGRPTLVFNPNPEAPPKPGGEPGMYDEEPDMRPGVAAADPLAGNLSALAATNPAPAEAMTALANNLLQTPQLQDFLDNGTNPVEPRPRAAYGAARPGKAEDVLVMVFRSNDPPRFQEEMKTYFTSNSIALETAPPAVQGAINSQLTNGSTLGNNTAEGTNRGANINPGLGQNNDQAIYPKDGNILRDNTGAGQNLSRNAAGANGGARRIARDVNVEALTKQEPSGPATAPSLPVEGVYVARNLPRRRAQELGDTLARQDEAREAEVFGRGGFGGGGGGGVSAAEGQQQAQANLPQQVQSQNTSTQQVSLAMQNAADRARNRQVSVLQQRASKALSQQQQGGQAFNMAKNDGSVAGGAETPRPRRPGAFAVPSRGAPGNSAPAIPETRATASGVRVPRPEVQATQPAPPATTPAEEAVDLVIVVQKAPPTTQASPQDAR